MNSYYHFHKQAIVIIRILFSLSGHHSWFSQIFFLIASVIRPFNIVDNVVLIWNSFFLAFNHKSKKLLTVVFNFSLRSLILHRPHPITQLLWIHLVYSKQDYLWSLTISFCLIAFPPRFLSDLPTPKKRRNIYVQEKD